MARSSKLSPYSGRDNTHKTRSEIDHLLHDYYLSLLEDPIPGELRNLVDQLLAIEARKYPLTERPIAVLQVAAEKGRNCKRTDRLP